MKKYGVLFCAFLPLFLTSCYFSAFNTPFVTPKGLYSVGGSIGRWIERDFESDTSRIPEVTLNVCYGIFDNAEAGILLTPNAAVLNFKYAILDKQLPILGRTGLAASFGPTVFYRNHNDKFLRDQLNYGVHSTVSVGFGKIYAAFRWDYVHLQNRDEFVFYPTETNRPGIVVGFLLGEDNEHALLIPEFTFYSRNHLYFSLGFRWRQLKSDRTY